VRDFRLLVEFAIFFFVTSGSFRFRPGKSSLTLFLSCYILPPLIPTKSGRCCQDTFGFEVSRRLSLTKEYDYANFKYFTFSKQAFFFHGKLWPLYREFSPRLGFLSFLVHLAATCFALFVSNLLAKILEHIFPVEFSRPGFQCPLWHLLACDLDDFLFSLNPVLIEFYLLRGWWEQKQEVSASGLFPA
jgi:hypothetical protein